MGLFDRFRSKGGAPQRAAAAGKLPARCVGLYVHVPFCVRKCLYCDFPSFAGSAEQQERYLKALHKEIALRGNLLGKGLAVDTVFFGGGKQRFFRLKLGVCVLI